MLKHTQIVTKMAAQTNTLVMSETPISKTKWAKVGVKRKIKK